ncbi:hypothetical protein E5206_09930 [Arthrobacter sp. PAMC25564]|nr:hypothetical protein E5206_09930 [Arthrobacter sp. PAMC25564]
MYAGSDQRVPLQLGRREPAFRPKLVFGIFAALAEFERELISERTIAGLASARARNGGRPYKRPRRNSGSPWPPWASPIQK